MEQRPDPDELLARVQAEAARAGRGRLKIFFGAAAGVGKTYAMLEAARQRAAEGVDVLVGLVETHGRAETEALLQGLELLPRHPQVYRGTTLYEFDLDAALARHPALILVDELAHTNAPGSRHAKRWQDVLELLDAGINVYTTVNVQHIESLNDVVAQITGVIVRETFPDSILEQADEVELVDLSPDDLLQRLREGKVYLPQQAERAIQNFFRKGNLIALRELALRRTADRVDAQMRDYRRDHAIAETWPTAERLLVCVGPGPLARRVVRAARRMATRLQAEWLVVFVETPAFLRLPQSARDQLNQTLHLAEQLGAETAILSGQRVSEEVLNYARQHNASKIVVGKPARPRWRDGIFGSVVDDIVRESGLIDVYVLSGDVAATEAPVQPVLRRTSPWVAYVWAIAVIGVCTLLTRFMFGYFELSDLIMIYLLGVMLVAMRFGRGPSVLASVLSVALFNFFYTHPYLTFMVENPRFIFTFAVMLVVALTISTLTVRIRQQAEASRQRERRTAALYALSREFASVRGTANLLLVAARHISDTFEGQVVVLLPDAQDKLQPWGGGGGWWEDRQYNALIFALDPGELGVAQWVFDHAQPAGLGTNTLPSARARYMPLVGSRCTVGVLGIHPTQAVRLQSPDTMHLLETCASQTALALERAQLAREAEQSQVQIASEKLRNALLSAVSHDLRTPLATITGVTSGLLEEAELVDPTTRRELLQAVYEEADRLSRLVSNLLDMTRLEAGEIHLKREWQPLEEVVGAALTHLDWRLQQHPVAIDLPPELPLIPCDGVMLGQVFINLLENAVKYAPPASAIDIVARTIDGGVQVTVADRGPGIAPDEAERIFDKFYRVQPTARSGVGLGLAICRGIITAHGGRIWVEQRAGGGAAFHFTLPVNGSPPRIEPEPAAVETGED